MPSLISRSAKEEQPITVSSLSLPFSKSASSPGCRS